MPCGFVDYPNKQFTQKQQAKPKYTPTRPAPTRTPTRATQTPPRLADLQQQTLPLPPLLPRLGALQRLPRPRVWLPAWGLGAKRHLALVSRRDVFKSGSVEEVVDLRCFKPEIAGTGASPGCMWHQTSHLGSLLLLGRQFHLQLSGFACLKGKSDTRSVACCQQQPFSGP